MNTMIEVKSFVYSVVSIGGNIPGVPHSRQHSENLEGGMS